MQNIRGGAGLKRVQTPPRCFYFLQRKLFLQSIFWEDGIGVVRFFSHIEAVIVAVHIGYSIENGEEEKVKKDHAKFFKIHFYLGLRSNFEKNLHILSNA